MLSKCFEIRDRATFIPVLCTHVAPTLGDKDTEYLMWRSGFRADSRAFLLLKLQTGESKLHSFEWNQSSRTMTVAHEYIERNFATLKNGDVVDVEFILKETAEPKKSERFVTEY